MENINAWIDAVHLSRCEGIGPAITRKLLERFGVAREVLAADDEQLRALGLHAAALSDLRDESLRAQARRDVERTLELGGRLVVPGDADYPLRLLRCSDAPVVLFAVGMPELNTARTVAVVGTRQVTPYGRACCEQIVAELAPYGVTVISGLAYGVDIVAHRAALAHGLPTVACLAHGIHRVYPNEHRKEAFAMLEQKGGWLTEFPPGVQPVRNNFPERNRIIAGLSDATVVIESGTKGGSMITARIASSYHREVFAVPGPITSATSAGCNALIRNLEAILLSHGVQVARELGWEKTTRPDKQLGLLLDLSEPERFVCDRLTLDGARHVDVLRADLHEAGFDEVNLAALLINLEMQGLIRQLPGQRFRLAL
jgi:DNA processing protein